MNKDTRGQRARRAYGGARRAWVLLNAARGTAHSQQARLGEDDEGRHGSSKWCSPSTPCQLLGEARREIWHGSVLSTERIIGMEASSPATSGVLQPEKFWSSAAQRGRRECLGKTGLLHRPVGGRESWHRNSKVGSWTCRKSSGRNLVHGGLQVLQHKEKNEGAFLLAFSFYIPSYFTFLRCRIQTCLLSLLNRNAPIFCWSFDSGLKWNTANSLWALNHAYK